MTYFILNSSLIAPILTFTAQTLEVEKASPWRKIPSLGGAHHFQGPRGALATCSRGVFVKFTEVRYYNHNWLRCHLFPYVPLVPCSNEMAVAIWGSSKEEVKLETHLIWLHWGTPLWFGHFHINFSYCWSSQHRRSSQDSYCPLCHLCRVGQSDKSVFHRAWQQRHGGRGANRV